MNDQQVPASKPLYLTPKLVGNVSPKSSTALYGATSAFLPKSPIPTVSITTASAGARLAAFAAGTNAQRYTPSTSPERQDGQAGRSQARGRQPHTGNNLTSGLKSIPSLNMSSQPAKPLLETRSSSTLAARHASAQSRSPHRSPIRSLNQSTASIGSVKENGSHSSSTDALSGATVSMAASSAREQRQLESETSVKSRVLNFEKLPSLPKPGLSYISDTATNGSFPTVELDPSEAIVAASQSPPRGNVLARQTRTHSAARVPITPSEILRWPSEESTATIATTTAASSSRSRDPSRFERPPIPARSSGSKILQARSPQHTTLRHQDDYRATMTVNALADAMVASSLASSRAASPSKKPPLPIPRRRSRSVAALYDMKSAAERQRPSKPTKTPRPMKQTLRKHPSSDDEEVELTKRGRRHWMRKHPNMHSEGDRKRWRDKVTEPERRRFEGVFAANRGLLIGPGYFVSSPSAVLDNAVIGNQVVNVVVRDIWERSRLPRDVLKEIYDLVSPEEAHALNREQFVVGLWLIDQRLKGRKLPVKVSASVWSSVRHSQGIKIRNQRS